MRRMANGAVGGMPDSEEEDPDLDELSMDEVSDEGGEEKGFFSGEDDLEAVNVGGDDSDGSGEELMSEGSYGSEGEEGDEVEEGEDLPNEEETQADKKKSKKRGRNSEYESMNTKETK